MQEKLTTPMAARFTETEAHEVDAMAEELKPGLFVGIRTGRAAVLRLSWLVTRKLIALGSLDWSLEAIQAFLSDSGLPSLQQDLKFPPRRADLSSEGTERLAATVAGGHRPLRFAASRPAVSTGLAGLVACGTSCGHLRPIFAGRPA